MQAAQGDPPKLGASDHAKTQVISRNRDTCIHAHVHTCVELECKAQLNTVRHRDTKVALASSKVLQRLLNRQFERIALGLREWELCWRHLGRMRMGRGQAAFVDSANDGVLRHRQRPKVDPVMRAWLLMEHESGTRLCSCLLDILKFEGGRMYVLAFPTYRLHSCALALD